MNNKKFLTLPYDGINYRIPLNNIVTVGTTSTTVLTVQYLDTVTDVSVIGQEGTQVVAVLARVEQDGAVVQPLKLYVTIVHQQHRGIVVGVEHRSAALDLHASLKYG